MESQRGKVIHPKPSSWVVTEPGMNPSIMNSCLEPIYNCLSEKEEGKQQAYGEMQVK